MENILEILNSFAIGTLGVVFYTVFKAGKHFVEWKPLSKPLSMKLQENGSLYVLIQENVGAWAWALIMLLLTSILINSVEGMAEVIASLTSMELTEHPTGFFVFGGGLSALVKELQKRTINND
jgi:uncharacterized membrane protein YfbV (UPF0208 family)